MQDNIGRTWQHRFINGKTFSDHRRPPFHVQGDGFDDWVKDVRSILQTQASPLTIPCAGKRTSNEGNAAQRQRSFQQ